MRFQLLSARFGAAALVLAALVAASAVGGVRLGLMPYPQGLGLMTPAVALALVALLCALAWLISQRQAGIIRTGAPVAKGYSWDPAIW